MSLKLYIGIRVCGASSDSKNALGNFVFTFNHSAIPHVLDRVILDPFNRIEAMDLLEFVELRSIECLNAKPDKGLGNALKQGYREDDLLVLESDTDEQLLIHIPFNTAVKLSSIILKSTTNTAQAPKKVKLFVNSPTIGFGEASDSSGVQDFDLGEDELKGEPIPLKLVKFNKVFCLTIFIESNQEDEDTTIVQKIAIYGQPGDKMNVGEIKDLSKEQD